MTQLSKYFVSLSALLFCIIIGCFSPLILKAITLCGHGIPSSDILSDYFIAVFWAIVFTIGIIFSWLDPVDKTAFVALWISKCLVTLGFMLIYENAYGLDAFYYFQVASADIYHGKDMAFGQGTEIVTAISWFLIHILHVGNSYHALKVIFSMVGLIGIYLFYLGVSTILQKKEPRNLYLLGLFPSMLFWSSILGKDPFNLLGIGLYFYGVTNWYREENWTHFFYVVCGMCIATAMRSWYMVILFLPFLFLVIRSFGEEKRLRRWHLLTMLAGLAGISALGFKMVVDRFHADNINQAISTTNTISHSWGYGGSAISEIPKFTTLGSMIAFAPYGIFTALFRPLPGEVMNGFGIIASIENLTLIYLIFRFVFLSPWKTWLRAPLGLWMVSLVLVWSSIYCFISPQNLGSAVRFKLQILPVILSLVIIGRWHKEREKCVE